MAPVLAPVCPPRVLTVAGSDSGSGAGIQADLKTFAALSTYGLTSITAITAQNTLGVQGIEGISPAMVGKQIRSVVEDIGVDAIKTGMLFSTEVIQSVVETFESLWKEKDSLNRRGEGQAPLIVVDPVLVSTSGHSLLPLEAVEIMRSQLLPWATVVTPNIPEAEVLARWTTGTIIDLSTMRRCARDIGNLGVRWIYLKGGHMIPIQRNGKKYLIDLLWDAREEKEYVHERLWMDSRNTHGTGCTLSAAIAAGLACGLSGLSTRLERVRCTETDC